MINTFSYFILKEIVFAVQIGMDQPVIFIALLDTSMVFASKNPWTMEPTLVHVQVFEIHDL